MFQLRHCDGISKCEECKVEICPTNQMLVTEIQEKLKAVQELSFEMALPSDFNITPNNFIAPFEIHKDVYLLYESLFSVLKEAFNQAAYGKGKERHASNNKYEEQPCCNIARAVGMGFPLGQAIKKIEESMRLEGERGIAELLGAINYIAAGIIVRREKENKIDSGGY